MRNKRVIILFLIVFMVISSVPINAMFSRNSYMFNKNEYYSVEAEVVDYTSHKNTKRISGRRRVITMYTPVYEYTDREGNIITAKARVSSSIPPEIGKIKTVYVSIDNPEDYFTDGDRFLMLVFPIVFYGLSGVMLIITIFFRRAY